MLFSAPFPVYGSRNGPPVPLSKKPSAVATQPNMDCFIFGAFFQPPNPTNRAKPGKKQTFTTNRLRIQCVGRPPPPPAPEADGLNHHTSASSSDRHEKKDKKMKNDNFHIISSSSPLFSPLFSPPPNPTPSEYAGEREGKTSCSLRRNSEIQAAILQGIFPYIRACLPYCRYYLQTAGLEGFTRWEGREAAREAIGHEK